VGERIAGSDKAAVLLLSIGPEAASEVLRHLPERDVREVSQALARMRSVAPEQIAQVRREFEERVGGGRGLMVDGPAFARTVVSKALADPASAAASQRGEILAEIEELASNDGSELARVLQDIPADGLAKLLENEHPQVAALMLAHLGAAEAAAVIGQLPEAVQGEMIERLAMLETVPPGVVAQAGAIFREQVKDLQRPPAGSALGGPRAVAEMLNHANKEVEARFFEALEQRDPALVATIRNLMFTFEDCLKLDNRSLQTLLKEVAREDLLLALKTASPALSEKVFANVSSRAAEILREDMASMGPARLKDVEAAQIKIVATLRELEAEGKLVVAGSGKDDVLV
jgi:flagellar motor switch protein FliG